MGINSCGTTLIDNGAFNNIGAISWDTTAKTAGFTAVAGNGYFVNTTSGQITVTLPSSPSAGDAVAIADYANTADTNKIIIDPNGNNIQGSASNFDLNTEGGTILLVYVDATKGWLSVDSAVASDIVNPAFTVATGGTITTCGDYKIHTFTSPGTFTVTAVGNAPTVPAGGPSNVDYLVVAGGGGGRDCEGYGGSAGGAGGYRTSYPSPAGTLPVSVTSYPITVGGGGSNVCVSSPSGSPGNGSNSVFSTITSTGGGGGGRACGGWASYPGGTGGSGGGGAGGTGNTPPVSPPQGFPGGNGCAGIGNEYLGGGDGGGGATAAGQNGNPNANADGGAGASNSITGSPVTYAGGGGGSGYGRYDSGCGGAGGGGKGGRGPAPSYGNPTGVSAVPGTINTGGGGGGGAYGSPANPSTYVGGTGGSGIVIIRYKYQ